MMKEHDKAVEEGQRPQKPPGYRRFQGLLKQIVAAPPLRHQSKTGRPEEQLATEDQKQPGSEVEPSRRSSLFDSSFESEPPDANETRNEGQRQKYRDPHLTRPSFWIPVTINALTLLMVGWYAWEARKQAKAATTAADAANRAVQVARDALAVTTELSRDDRRAWIGPTEAMPPEFNERNKVVYLKEGESMANLGIYLTNSGKTPAQNIMQRFAYRTLSAGVEFSPVYPSKPQSIGSLQPGFTIRLVAPPTPKATRAQIASYSNGSLLFYIFGHVTYDDVFGRPHETTFCMWMLQSLSAFTDCGTYNKAD